MKGFEREIEMIRTQWFPRHQATVLGEEHLKVIEWKNPKRSLDYAVRYIFSEEHLFIIGDMGEATVHLGFEATPENVKEMGLHPFLQRLRAHSGDRWDFDSEKAQKELEDWHEERQEEGEQADEEYTRLYEQLCNATLQWTTQGQFGAAVFSIYQNSSVEWFDAEEASMVSHFGEKLPDRLLAYWVGLQMAME